MSGSNKRQRPHKLTARFNAQEAAAVARKAEHAGISRSAFIRFAALGTPPPRGRRSVSANEKLLLQILAQLGKIGSNVNQLAHYAHLDRYQPQSVQAAMRELTEMRDAVMQALGHERPLPQLPHDEEED